MKKILTLGIVAIFLHSCTSASINLSSNESQSRQEEEASRVLSSALSYIKILDEDVENFMSLLYETDTPVIKQALIRLLSLKGSQEVYEALLPFLSDPNNDVSKETTLAFLRADPQYFPWLVEIAENEDINFNIRTQMIARLSQEKELGLPYLIQLLSSDNINIAKSAASHCQRLYKNYDNSILQGLLASNQSKNQYAALPWLVRYPQENALYTLISFITNDNTKMSQRALFLYTQAGLWSLDNTVKLLEQESDSYKRVVMINKLCINKDARGIAFLPEMYASPNAEYRDLGLEYTWKYGPVVLPMLRTSFESPNENVRYIALQAAQDFEDKVTLLTIVPLLNDNNKDIRALAQSYISKYSHLALRELAYLFDPNANTASNLFIYRILLQTSSPFLISQPSNQTLDAKRLIFLCKNTTPQDMRLYLSKLNSSFSRIDLRNFYNLYQNLIVESQKINSSSLVLFNEAFRLSQTNAIPYPSSEQLKQATMNYLVWLKSYRSASSTDQQRMQSMAKDVQDLYYQYLALRDDYRTIMTEIGKSYGIDLAALKWFIQNIPKI